MKNIIFLLILSATILACTSEQVKEYTYNAAASHQCFQDFENNPNGDKTSADCPTDNELDGKTYEEYKKDRALKR